MKLELIRWIDSTRHMSGWQSVDYYVRESEGSMECETVGFIVHERDDSIMVAQSRMIEGQHVTEVIQIPVIAIQQRQDLGETKKRARPERKTIGTVRR